MPYRKSTRIQRPRAWATTGGLYAGALAAVLVACTTATPRLTSPAPATLAAVRGLVRHPCAATTASALDALGVRPSTLRSIYYDPRVSGGERGYLQGYDVWVRLADQPGDLVIRHDAGCRFITSYASGTVRAS